MSTPPGGSTRRGPTGSGATSATPPELVAGALADAPGLNATVIAAAALTAASGLLAARWITDRLAHRPSAHRVPERYASPPTASSAAEADARMVELRA